MVAEVYKITTRTTHCRVSKGSDLTIKAAINTAMEPGMAMARAAFRLYDFVLMNFTEARGIRKAQEPIMMGKATVGDIPKAKIKAIQGAYKPTPAVMIAPKKKLTTTAKTSL